MDPVTSQNNKWAEIKEHGLFGRPLLPFFKPGNRKWLALAGLASLGISLYWSFSYSGPYRYLAELDLKWIGSYSPELTGTVVFMGVLLGTLCSAVSMKLLFGGAEKPVPGMPIAAEAAPVATNNMGSQFEFVQQLHLWAWRACPVLILIGSLVIFGFGAYMYYTGANDGNLQKLSAADFQQGKLRGHSVYADVRGYLSGPYISKDYYLYIPMTSERKPAARVHLLIGVQEHERGKYVHRETDGTYTVRGVADEWMRLDSDVKYAFEKNGVAMADTVWVVHAGGDPSSQRASGLAGMGLGIVGAALVLAWQSYRKRKRSVAQPAGAAA